MRFQLNEILSIYPKKKKELRIRNYWKVASHADVLRGSSRVMSAWEAILKVVCLYNGSVQRLRTTIGIRAA